MKVMAASQIKIRRGEKEHMRNGEKEIKMYIFVKIAAFCNVFFLQKKEAS
jgi:hypothetical protein